MRLSTLGLIVLAGATLATGTLAWQQYRRAEGLAAALAEASTPGVSHLPPAESIAPAAPAFPSTPAEESAEAAEPDSDEAIAASRPAGRRDPASGRFNQLMEDPTFAAAWQNQQKARLDERYADLFRRLNLAPAEIERLKTLLADRQAARMDVFAAARGAGLTGRENQDELRQLVQQADAEIDASIRQLLGDARYTQYERYEQTAPQRAVVSQLETRLSYSAAPLTAAQSEVLVTLLEQTAPPTGRTGRTGGFGGPNASGTLITDATIARAQGVLTAAQVEALRQIQAEQQAQQQMQEMMRRQFQTNRRPGGG